MKTRNEISDALKGIHFSSFPFVIKHFLSAFNLPHSTIDRVVERIERNFNEPVFVYRKAVILCSNELSFTDFEHFAQPYHRFPLVLCFTKAGLFVRNESGVSVFYDYNDLSQIVEVFGALYENPKGQKDVYKARDFSGLVASLYNSLLLAENDRDSSISCVFNTINLALFVDESTRKDIRLVASQPTANYGNTYSVIINKGKQSQFVKEAPIVMGSDSFQYFRAIVEFDVDNLDIEELSSLVYKLFSDDATLYGPQTSYLNVQKIIGPLIVDELKLELSENPERYHSVAKHILSSYYVDPTNGPGCFLSAAYSELKDLLISLDNEHGTDYGSQLECKHFVALVDNQIAYYLSRLTLAFCILQYITEPSLDIINTIFDDLRVVSCNQLNTNWLSYTEPNSYTYFFGSPRFWGYKRLPNEKKEEMQRVFGGSVSDADYCSAWLVKSASYVNQGRSKAAFVLTNSIVQGSQVPEIWSRVYNLDCEIFYAYDSFKWKPADIVTTNIGVSVVIVGIQRKQDGIKRLYHGDEMHLCQSIGPYLIPDSDTIVNRSNASLFNVLPSIRKGNMPYDNGHLLINSSHEYMSIVDKNKAALEFIKRIVGSEEFINAVRRWCLWIPDEAERAKAIEIKEIKDRIDAVRSFRATSTASERCKSNPHQFRECYSTASGMCSLVIPSVSSENRPYIPIGFINDKTIVSNLAFAVYNCEPWVLCVLSSKMHMLWMKTVCGALETRYRYSNVLCYNTFPLPYISSSKKKSLTDLSFLLIKTRENHCDLSLGDLYNDMPKDLISIHDLINENVDSLYQDQPFESDLERLSCLINMYNKRIANE